MNSTRTRNLVLRHVLLLLVLSVGLTGCKTCKNLRDRLSLFGHKPEVVESLPPDLGESSPTPYVGVEDTKEAEPTDIGDGELRPTQPPVPEMALKTVHFDYDSAALTDVARRILDQNIAWLRENPDVKVQVEGHCDERGTEEYNMNLGARRAKSVVEYMIRNGIDRNRLFAISFGEQVPVDPGHDESAWWKNRRVEFSRL